MSQRMSSENQNAQRTTAKKGTTLSGAICVLPEEEDLLGRCWLLASSADSLSPSRWFSLSPKNRRGAREANRRAFTISSHVLSSSERSRQPVLRDLNINVHKGLSVCGYPNITVAAFPTAAAQPHRTFRIGGVHVELPALPERFVDDAAGPSQFVVVVIRRVSVEADLREYATAPFTRVAVCAPPTTAEERHAYGEGCITGILYGAVIVLHVPASLNAAATLARLCEEAAAVSGVSPSALQVQEGCEMNAVAPTTTSTAAEGAGEASSSSPSPSSPSYVHLLCVEATSKASEQLRSEWDAQAAEKTDETPAAAREALTCVATWAVRLHQDPSAWCPLNLFLQRYEAIAESLLVKSKRK